jgi:soluble lytic murein transglycosylase
MRYVPSRTARAIVYWNVVAAATLIALGFAVRINRSHVIDEMIVQYSKAHDLDPRFVACVAWRESRFKPMARSKAGARGVMQISREVGLDWAKAHKVKNYEQNHLYIPDVNIRVGTWNLARLMKRWSKKKDPLPYVLASYVAGPGHADRWDKLAGGDEDKFLDAITFPVAKVYIQDILKRYRGHM